MAPKRSRVGRLLLGVSIASTTLALAACGIGASRTPAGSAGIADSAASSASAPAVRGSASAPGAR